MVGSAGNAPVRRFRLCFATPDLQSGSRITSRRLACRAKALPARIDLVRPRALRFDATAIASFVGEGWFTEPQPGEGWEREWELRPRRLSL